MLILGVCKRELIQTQSNINVNSYCSQKNVKPMLAVQHYFRQSSENASSYDYMYLYSRKSNTIGRMSTAHGIDELSDCMA